MCSKAYIEDIIQISTLIGYKITGGTKSLVGQNHWWDRDVELPLLLKIALFVTFCHFVGFFFNGGNSKGG